MSGDPARAALDAELIEWTRESSWGEDEERFDSLARRLFAHQFERCAPYRRFCEGRGRTPARVGHWREIPAVPTGAFKEVALRSFPASRVVHTFRTSGTTTQRRGALELDTLAPYEASLLPGFVRFLLPDLHLHDDEEASVPILVLAPSPAEARDSSLTHMFGVAIRELGAPESRFLVDGDRIDLDGLRRAADACAAAPQLLLCGTAFAFVHLLELLEARGETLALPPGTRLMETGGFKGRARALSRSALYARLERALGVPLERIVNQYGMTELASQFYDSVLRDPGGERRKLGPPWARVRILDPETGEDATPGETGSIAIADLANTGSVLAVQTADLGRGIGDGFEVLGREPGAEERGCSIAADELLGAAP